jgi:hypothetical protein
MPAYRQTLAFLCPRLALTVLALAATLSFAQDSFMSHYTPGGFGDTVINRGDFNNDGIPDIVTGNNGGSNGTGVSVLLGKGDGRFRNPINGASGVGTWDMTIGDFNGDGKLDVALAGYVNSTNGVVQIMLGNGDGTFRKGQTISMSNIPRSITTADFNNDGHLDLAVALDRVYLFKGAGNGTFSGAGSLKVGTQSILQQVRVGDFNADGKADVMVGDGFTLFVLWNTGSFTFKTVQVATSSNGMSGTPVDVNQDHFTDLLVTYFTCSGSGACTNWKVLLGHASKTFTQSANMNLGSGFQGFWGTTAADINGDGINDVVGISGVYELLIFLGNPDGTYASTPLEFPIGSNSSASDVMASDFNRDGKIDFAMPTPGTASTIGVAAFLNATPRKPCTPSQGSPSVTVCRPQDLAYSNSPVTLVAEARDTSHPVTKMQVYVDNSLAFQTTNNSFTEPITMSKGPHFVVTKAFDSAGANFESDRRVTIYAGTAGETCPAAANSLNICSPSQNATTTTSVHVFANSFAGAVSITAVQVYIDGKLIYNDTSGATYVDTAFTVAKGSHSIVVKAWDAHGSNFSESRTINAQ